MAMVDRESDVQDIAHFTYIWTIENARPIDALNSPVFTVQAMDNSFWYLSLECDDISGFIGLGLVRSYGDDNPWTINSIRETMGSIDVKFELSFLGINGLPIFKKLFYKLFNKGDNLWFGKFAKLDTVFVQKKADIFPRDALTISCRMWRIGSEISRYELCFARTLLREFRGSCLSEIKEFSKFLLEQKREVHFIPTEEEAIELLFHLCINFAEEDIQYLRFEQRLDKKICKCKAKISLLDAKGKVVHSAERGELVFWLDFFEDFFEVHKLRENKSTLFPDDVLSLRCEYEMVTTVWSRIENYICLKTSKLEETTTETVKMNLDKQDETFFFTNALKNLFQEGTFSDVCLQAGHMSFPTHKCILSARSPVFKAMFRGDMKEKTSKCVEIPDLDHVTLRKLLFFIYTGTVSELEEQSALDLYKAANKYKLLDLKRKCANFLKSDLSVSNVSAVLTVANLHNDRELREAAQDFVMHQGEEFFTSDEWRSFKEENTKLALETMERILCNLKSHH